jgi:hypothetical protein
MALTPVQEVRVAVGDTDPTFPILDDPTYEYFLEKNQDSIRRASLDAARSILLQLSMRTDETVDIFSVKGSKAAEQYRLALQMFLRDPNLNPVLTSATGYAGGISKSDMQSNIENPDNNYVVTPGMKICPIPSNPFSI